MKALSRLALAGAVFLSAVAAPALACGGFFCNRNPIDQSGEKILFVRDGDMLRAIVQVQYVGAAEDFSWVVPVQGRPTVGVATNEVFSRLEPVTQARVQLDLRDDETCRGLPVPLFSAPTAMLDGAPRSSGVNVVEEGTVGPYDYRILEATDAAELSAWLAENRYVLPDRFSEVTTTYVKPGYTFVAIKLTQKAGAGDIAPVVLSYPTTMPCVPLILTSIAARENMPITAYLAGPGRAVPVNYKHVRINEARLDWLGQGSNYNRLVTEAIDEAGGRAFVTDYATGSAEVAGVLRDRYDVDAIRSCKTAEEAIALIRSQGFTIDDQLRAIAAAHGVSLPVFRGGFFPLPVPDERPGSIVPFDAAGLADDLRDKIVKPLRDVQGWVAKVPYVTRLYTTMSPREMTTDPEIDYHLGSKDFPDVSNVHRARGLRLCGETDDFFSAPVEITLADGTTFRVDPRASLTTVSPDSGSVSPGQGPLPVVAGKPVALPAAAVIEQLNILDAGEIQVDNRQRIQAILAGQSDPGPVAGGSSGGSGTASGAGAGGSAASSSGSRVAGVPGCSCANPTVPRSSPFEGAGEAGLGIAMGLVGWWRARRIGR